MVRVCIVCLGNICRSPTAEAILRHHVEARNLTHAVRVESAGTGSWHVGHTADRRSRAEAKRRGITIEGRARQFKATDFDRFDYVLAVDRDNQRVLLDLAEDDVRRSKVHLIRSFDPQSPPNAEVPDPYYGGDDGFSEVFDICDTACRGFLDHVEKHHVKA